MTTPPDLDYLPHDRDAARPEDLTRKRRDPRKAPAQPPMPGVLSAAAPASWPDLDPSAAPFLYIGVGLTPTEFKQYCLDYDFGSVPPSYWVWHHTYSPDASWGPASSTSSNRWDAGESGLTTAQIYEKRRGQLRNIMVYYRDTKGWTVGPHLFTDDRWIWLFTPMYDVGIHCNEGNSYTRNGKLRYSIGCEVVGAYDAQPWPTQIRAMAGWACACVKARLNYANVYTSAPQDRPDLHDPQLSGHRDYTTDKSCPGRAITEPFYVQAAVDGWAAYVANTPPTTTKPGAGLYHVRHSTAVFESPEPDGRIALGDTAVLAAGEQVELDEIAHGGWGHLRSGLGFVPSGILTRIA